MKAAVYYGPKDIRCTEIADSALKAPHEIMVRVNATSICGSDLHLYRGALDPIMARGQSQTGHELVGEVIEVGASVGRFRRGDRVTMAYSVSCGDCHMCHRGQTAHCETTGKAVYGFGIPFGNMNGTHAETLVLPHADGHVMKVPAAVSDAAALTLSCNLPTAVIANRLADIQPGETVALIGCGPTGLMCLDVVAKRGAGLLVAFDRVPHRLTAAAARGATVFDIDHDGTRDEVMALTRGRGFDKVIEVVGLPETLQFALDLVRPGGTVAAVGVFCDNSFNLDLGNVFLRDISLHMNGFANAQPAMWEALRLLENGVVDGDGYFSHNFRLDEIDRAFATFHDKADGVHKVVIRP